ncbi:MAG: filamentous hemagglutinin N-terminal domain-containing protein, partial [Methylococcales bacterium]
MSNRTQSTHSKSSDVYFRLKPLVSGVRIVIAGGLIVGSSVSTANPPLPIPTFNTITEGQAPTPIIEQSTYGQATAAIADHTMNIHQITDKATIDWQSFNIDKGYTVNFQQPTTTSTALNNIHDANATQILG